MNLSSLISASIAMAADYATFLFDKADNVWELHISPDIAEEVGEFLATNADDETLLELFAPGNDEETRLLREVLVGVRGPDALLRLVGREWLERYAPEIEEMKAINERLARDGEGA